jgi:hypothetical protein
MNEAAKFALFRERLAESRSEGLTFDAAWDDAMHGRVAGIEGALTWSRPAWESAYDGTPADRPEASLAALAEVA